MSDTNYSINGQPIPEGKLVASDPFTIQPDQHGLSLWLTTVDQFGRSRAYRLDALDAFPQLSLRDRAMALGVLEYAAAQVRAQYEGQEQ